MFKIDDREFRRCPLHYLGSVSEFLSYFAHYKAGFLPVAGGIADQAGVFLAAARFFDGELTKALNDG